MPAIDSVMRTRMRSVGLECRSELLFGFLLLHLTLFDVSLLL